MPQKRWHHKSRQGCLQCRQRRIKCRSRPANPTRLYESESHKPLANPEQLIGDEQRPVCRGCTRASLTCQYTAPRASSSTAASSAPTPVIINNNNYGNQYNSYTTMINTPALPAAPSSPAPFNYEHLEFMHHYCTVLYRMINESPTSAAYYSAIPPLALPYDFATSAMFATTAAHMATVKPDGARYCALAHKYLGDALRQSRAAPNLLDPQQCGALYIAGIFIGLTITALPGLDQGRAADPLNRWIAAARAWRGVTIMFSTCTAFGQQKPTASLPPRQNDDGHQKPPAPYFWNTIIPTIRSLITEKQCRTDQQRRVYLGLLEEAQNMFRASCIADNSAAGVLTRPTDNELYYSLLIEGDTVASCLAIVNATLQHQFDHLWYMRGMQADAARVFAERIKANGGDREAVVADWALDWVERDVTPSGFAAGGRVEVVEDE